MAKSCFIVATWLTYMLSVIPDTGVKIAARKSLLDEFINVLQSSKNHYEKILATLALKTFINDRGIVYTRKYIMLCEFVYLLNCCLSVNFKIFRCN